MCFTLSILVLLRNTSIVIRVRAFLFSNFFILIMILFYPSCEICLNSAILLSSSIFTIVKRHLLFLFAIDICFLWLKTCQDTRKDFTNSQPFHERSMRKLYIYLWDEEEKAVFLVSMILSESQLPKKSQIIFILTWWLHMLHSWAAWIFPSYYHFSLLSFSILRICSLDLSLSLFF